MANTTTGYLLLSDAARGETLAAAGQQAQRAAAHCAQLHTAQAGIAARNVFPHLARLVFRLTDDVTGPSATLVAAYTGGGRRLWHIDAGDEWPDESLITDHLAAAAHWDEHAFTTLDTELRR